MSYRDDPTVTIAAVGDVRPQRARIERRPGDRSALQHLEADLVFGNLEVVLTPPLPGFAKPVVARADPASIEVLREMKLGAVSLANNHALDFGVQGLENMTALLDETGIPYIGAGPNAAAAWAPHHVDISGLRVALLAMCGTVPPGAAAQDNQPGIAGFQVETAYRIDSPILHEQPGTPPWVQTWVPAVELERLHGAVAAAKAAADILVVAVHWGVAYQDETADYQRQLAQTLAGAGASLIIGHHPHQLQGVGFEAGIPVLYSLGDFLTHFRRPRHVRFPGLSSMDPKKVERTVIARVTIGRAGVRRLELVPLILDEMGEPQLATEAQAAALFGWIGDLSAPLGAALRPGANGAMEVVPAPQDVQS